MKILHGIYRMQEIIFYSMKISLSLLVVMMLTLLASCTQSPNTTSTVSTPTAPATPVTTTTTIVTTTGDQNVAPQGAAMTNPTQTMTPVVPTQLETDIETETYRSPGGPVTVEFHIVENDAMDTIESASVRFVSGDDMSRSMVENFSQHLSAAVVGKKISELRNIDAIGGASLTTAAFIDAIN